MGPHAPEYTPRLSSRTTPDGTPFTSSMTTAIGRASDDLPGGWGRGTTGLRPAPEGRWLRPGRQARHLVREPGRVDCRALGQPARRCRRRPGGLPRVVRSRARASAPIVRREVVLVGDEVERADRRYRRGLEAGGCRPTCSRTSTAARNGIPRAPPPRAPVPLAEIIFTSGATAEPKGVTITHRNILANIIPIEREIAKYREVRPAVSSDSVPESASAQPHVRPVDGDLRAADARGHRRLLARLQPGRDHPSDQIAPRVGARVRAKGARRPARSHVERVVPHTAGPDRWRASTGPGAGGTTATCIGCSAGSSGASSAARHRSILSSRRSGASSASSSCRATASRRPRRSSR